MLVLRKEWINLTKVKINSLSQSELLTFKTINQDRSVSIQKIDTDCYEVLEDGFNRMTYHELNEKQLVNLLRKLDTLEFTKSSKLCVSIQKTPIT